MVAEFATIILFAFLADLLIMNLIKYIYNNLT